MRKCEVLPLPTSCRCHHPMYEWMTTTTLHITTLLALCKPTNHQTNKQTDKPSVKRKHLHLLRLMKVHPGLKCSRKAADGILLYRNQQRNIRENVLLVVVVVVNTNTLTSLTYIRTSNSNFSQRSPLSAARVGVSQPKDVDKEAAFSFLLIMLISLACYYNIYIC